jgi:hypothetical protein
MYRKLENNEKEKYLIYKICGRLKKNTLELNETAHALTI